MGLVVGYGRQFGRRVDDNFVVGISLATTKPPVRESRRLRFFSSARLAKKYSAARTNYPWLR